MPASTTSNNRKKTGTSGITRVAAEQEMRMEIEDVTGAPGSVPTFSDLSGSEVWDS